MMSYSMFLFFILSIAIPYVCSLKCYCANDGQRFCDLAYDACNTSGICVGELVKHELINIIVQSCLPEEEIANSCNELNDIFRTRLCCHENFCNSERKIYQYYRIQPPDFNSSNQSVPLTSTFNVPSDSSSYNGKSTADYPYSSNSTYLIFIIIPLVFVVLSAISFLTVCVLVVLLCIYSKRLHARRSFTYQEQLNQFVPQYTEFPLACESGSGSGMAQLSQVTIARQVVKGQIIGSGRYGEVWKGVWRDQSVAVKIFYSIEAESWEAETGIYMTDLIRHENILGFIAADKIDMENSFQYWLVTDYIEHGSLLEYLSENRLNLEDSFRLAKSAAAGVSHLHSEIKGGCKFNSTQVLSKPCIAHRDIKSKNILVNSFKECVIADFGLAVHLTETNKTSIVKTFYERVGTKRYMSPELLSNKIDEMDMFEVYKRADVYSLSLVLWEIFRRCQIDNCCDEFQLPYFDSVSQDPSFSEVQKMILYNRIRPIIPKRWKTCPKLEEISDVILECLLNQEEVTLCRFAPSLPSHLIKKRLVSMFQEISIK